MNNTTKNILTVLGITYGLTVITDFITYKLFVSPSESVNALLSIRMFVPAIAVIIFHYICGKCLSLSVVGLSLTRSRRAYAFAIIAPIAVFLVSLAISALLGFEVRTIQEMYEYANQKVKQPIPMVPSGFLMVLIVIGILTGITFNALFAFGEEILWRGLIPTLLGLRYKFFYATAFSWVFWFLWHLPLTALLQYNYPLEAPRALVLLASALVTFGMTLTMMPLRYNTNSVIPTALLHGMTMSMGIVADYFISDTLWTGASGIITGIVWTLAGLVSYFLFVKDSNESDKF